MNRIFIFVLLYIFNFNVPSQEFHGGVLLGLTASQVDGDSYAGYDKLGIQGGIFVTRELTSYLDARLEIRYASRGARNPASDDNTGSYLLALHYVDLPVMGALRIKNYGSFELGLIPGYLFAVNGEDDNGTLLDGALVDFRKFDLGILVGGNIRIAEKFSLSLRYSYSIFSIRESAGDNYSWFGKIFGHSHGDFNNYLTMGINYQIR